MGQHFLSLDLARRRPRITIGSSGRPIRDVGDIFDKSIGRAAESHFLAGFIQDLLLFRVGRSFSLTFYETPQMFENRRRLALTDTYFAFVPNIPISSCFILQGRRPPLNLSVGWLTLRGGW